MIRSQPPPDDGAPRPRSLGSLRPPARTEASPLVALEPIAEDQAPTLRNMFELYVHDFSEWVPLELKPNGRFDVDPGDLWWKRDDHFPFFVRSGGNRCGFALVRRGSRVTGAGDVMDVAEFFVVRGVRRKGVGVRAAHALFAAFPSVWEIRVRRTNVPATRFWVRAVESWGDRSATRELLSCDGIERDLLRVDTRTR